MFKSLVLIIISQIQKAKTILRDNGHGISDFKTMITTKKQMYIDKTLFIKEVMHCSDKIVLITRPPLFGKTLALSTLELFLSIHNEDSQQIFEGLAIMKTDPDLDQLRKTHMGKHPVIRLDFSNIRGETFQQSYSGIQEMISKEFSRHRYLVEANNLLKGMYEAVLNQTADVKTTANSIHWLSRWIDAHHNRTRSIIILIDGYDIPIQFGYLDDYRTDIVELMRSLLQETLAKNKYLMKAVITGVTPVKEDIASSTLMAHTVLDRTFSSCFGFTHDNVEELIKRTNKDRKVEQRQLDRIDSMFKGYHIGDSIIFNPRAVTRYLFENEVGGSIDPRNQRLLEQTILENGMYPILTIQLLLQGETATKQVSEGVSLADINDHEGVYWSYLLHLGYLTGKPLTAAGSVKGTTVALRVPNLEMHTLIATTIQKLADQSKSNYHRVLYDIVDMDLASAQTFGWSSLTIPDFKRFISGVLDWNLIRDYGLSTRKIPNYKRFVDDVVKLDLASIRTTLDYYLQNPGQYFGALDFSKRNLCAGITKYVTDMLRGAELRLNTTAMIRDISRQNSRWNEFWQGMQIRLNINTKAHAQTKELTIFGGKEDANNEQLKITVLTHNPVAVSWKNFKSVMCPFANLKKKLTQILIVSSGYYHIHTCLREAHMSELDF